MVSGTTKMRYAVKVGSGYVLFPSTDDITWKPSSAAEFDTEEEAEEVAQRFIGSTVVYHPMATKYCVVVVQPFHDGRWQYVSHLNPLRLSINLYMAWTTMGKATAEHIATHARMEYPDAIVHVKEIA